jgi:hypothetical protein
LGAGYVITPKKREKLFNRILKKPLETSIRSDSSITSNDVSESALKESALKELIDNPILKRFKSDFKTEEKELRYLNLEPLVILLLSVIRDTQTKKIKHLLFITLLAISIGKEINLGTYEMTNLSFV